MANTLMDQIGMDVLQKNIQYIPVFRNIGEKKQFTSYDERKQKFILDVSLDHKNPVSIISDIQNQFKNFVPFYKKGQVITTPFALKTTTSMMLGDDAKISHSDLFPPIFEAIYKEDDKNLYKKLTTYIDENNLYPENEAGEKVKTDTIPLSKIALKILELRKTLKAYLSHKNTNCTFNILIPEDIYEEMITTTNEYGISYYDMVSNFLSRFKDANYYIASYTPLLTEDTRQNIIITYAQGLETYIGIDPASTPMQFINIMNHESMTKTSNLIGSSSDILFKEKNCAVMQDIKISKES